MSDQPKMLERDRYIQEIPAINSIWQHKNGQYLVYDITNEYSDGPDKYPMRVSYMGRNGRKWSGNLSDWHRRMTYVHMLEKDEEFTFPIMYPIKYIAPSELIKGFVAYCADCGCTVSHYTCNEPLIKERPQAEGWDWYTACDNVECKNHEGTGIFQSRPAWESFTPVA